MKKDLTKKFLLLHFLITIIFITAKAQYPISSGIASSLQTRIDSIVVWQNLPGISVSILFPGNQYWNGASGLSHIYNLTPMDTSMLFEMASVNKLYVAAMIFQLREQGFLSLDDTVGKYLPPMTNVPSSISIRNLLKHRSGLYDLVGHPSIFNQWIAHPDSIWPHLQTIQTFVNPPTFAQGTAFAYSNTNYILLGMIIESITGNTFATELKNRFLIPLNLSQTFFAPDDSIAGIKTTGWTSFTTQGVYDTDASLILNDCSASMFFTAGAIVAKPGDVAKFTRALWTGQILADSSLDTMKQCTNVIFGQGSDGYGFGTMRYKFNGNTYYGHAGDVNGFTQLSVHGVDDDITITVSVNRNNAPRGLIAGDLLYMIDQLLTSVNNLSLSNDDFIVYPNPASDKINIRLNSDRELSHEVIITDQTGRKITDDYFADNNLCIDATRFDSGLYNVTMISNEGVLSRKVIVVK